MRFPVALDRSAGAQTRNLAFNVRSYCLGSELCLNVVRKATPSNIKGMFKMTRVIPIITN
jgi:hypothetical protein